MFCLLHYHSPQHPPPFQRFPVSKCALYSFSNKCIKAASILGVPRYSHGGPQTPDIWTIPLHMKIQGHIRIFSWTHLLGLLDACQFLVPNIFYSVLGVIYNHSVWRAWRDGRKRLTPPDGQAAYVIDKKNPYEAFVVHMRQVDLHTSWPILNIYIEALTGFNNVFSPGGLDRTFLSPRCILGMTLFMQMVGHTHIPGHRRETGAFSCPSRVQVSGGDHVLSMSSPNKWVHCLIFLRLTTSICNYG